MVNVDGGLAGGIVENAHNGVSDKHEFPKDERFPRGIGSSKKRQYFGGL